MCAGEKKMHPTHPPTPACLPAPRHFWCHNAARNELGGGGWNYMLESHPGARRVCTARITENKCNHAHTTAVKHPRGKIQSISHICARRRAHRPLCAKLNSPDDFYCKEFHIFAPTWKQLAWWCFIFIVSDRYYFSKRVVTHTLFLRLLSPQQRLMRDTLSRLLARSSFLQRVEDKV